MAEIFRNGKPEILRKDSAVLIENYSGADRDDSIGCLELWLLNTHLACL